MTFMHSSYYRLKLIKLVKSPHYIYILLLFGMLSGSVFSYGITPLLLFVFIAPYLIQFFIKIDWKLKNSIIRTFSFFIGFHSMVLVWFLQSDVNGLIEVSTKSAEKASLISYIIMVVFLTLLTLPLSVLLTIKESIKNRFLLILLLSALWVITEYIKSIGFSIFLYGPGASFGDFWNFGDLGMALMFTPLAYLSRIVGMYGLSFLAVFVVSTLLNVFLSKKDSSFKKLLISSIIIVALLTVFSWKIYLPSNSIRSRASVLQIEKQTPNLVVTTPVSNNTNEKKDLIVLPEYSSTYELGFSKFRTEQIDNRLAENGVAVNVGEEYVMDNKRYGKLEMRNNEGALIDSQSKQLLIPTGEYLPYIISTFYKLANQSYITEKYNNSRQILRGENPRLFENNGVEYGSVACSGILSREIYRNLSRSGAEVFTNSASLLIFNNSKSYFRQSLMMAKFHAVANSRPYIQASKGASAFVFDQNGDYIVRPGANDTKFTDFEFKTNSQKTFYTLSGEIFLLLSFLTVSIYGLIYFESKTGIRNKTKAKNSDNKF